MLKYFLILLVLQSFAMNLLADDEDNILSNGKYFKQNDTAYTFFSESELKLKPNKDSKTIAKIPIGTQLIIDTLIFVETDSNKENLIFYKINYKNTKCFISKNSLAIKKLKIPKKTSYLLFHISESNENNLLDDYSHNLLLIKEINKDSIYNATFLKLQGVEFEIHLIDNKGLRNADFIAAINFFRVGCSDNAGVTYLTYNNNRLNELANLFCYEDAGVSSYEESLIFPNDSSGIQDKIIYKSILREYLEESTSWIKETKEERIYDWIDGKLYPPFKSEAKNDFEED